ncbi:TPA: hypothetical protein DCW38_06080 [candidate division WOR-3 bacterium]|jgi:hydrogenase-4 component E|uniref:Hydrogenase n=1 Tax=candidate division WOR-3 bacterium TaxID=2052148 RepID=A0A350HB15_UNCW3|nr:hypothetical protein [candidate division WOR-3 bacterium]
MYYGLLVLFALTVIYFSVTSRLRAYVNALAAQGVILFLIVLVNMKETNFQSVILILIETIGFKTILIPYILNKIIYQNEASREIDAGLSNFFSILAMIAIFSFGFILSFWTKEVLEYSNPFHFGVAFSSIIAGMYIILTKKRLITHIMGYMVFENGIFLFSLTLLKEMPLIVNLGVLLELFMIIFVSGFFVTKIKESYNDDNIDNLTDLRD